MKSGFQSVLIACLLVCHLATPPLKAELVRYSAEVFAAVTDEIRQCSTCPNPRTSTADENGGADALRASASVITGDGNGGSASGSAVLQGPNMLPLLIADAKAPIWVEGEPPNEQVHLYEAAVSSRGRQLFRFIGNTLETYTLEYRVDGAIFGGHPDGLNNNYIEGGVAVYESIFDSSSEVNPLRDCGPTHPECLHQLAVSDAGLHSFSGSLTFGLYPGVDQFSVVAFLAVGAGSGRGFESAADASNTMTVYFTQGDTSLLIPASPVIPEPGTLALLCAGLLGLGAMTRRP